MNGVAIASLVLEIAAGAAVQTSGAGGPIAAVGALMLVLITMSYIAVQGRRRSPVARLRSFLATRRAMQPLAESQLREYNRDTLDAYRRDHERAVRAYTRRLRKAGIIGGLEEMRLNNPSTVRDLEVLVERLAECETQE